MYLGNNSHRNVPGCDSYASAEITLARAAEQAGKLGSEETGWPLARHSKSVTWVRRAASGDIIFQLYDTEVVTWHPDETVTIRNYGTQTTTEFADHFLPAGFRLAYETRRGGNRTIRYKARPGDSWWAGQEICEGGAVQFEPLGDGAWRPVSGVWAMDFPVLDRKAAREVAREHHLSDFRKWLGMAPMHLDIEHQGYVIEDCTSALRHRDFRTAAMTMPTIENKRTFGRDPADHALPIRTRSWREVITHRCVDRLRQALYARCGALRSEEFMTLPAAEFERRMTTLRQLAALGVGNSCWGPQR